MLKSGVSSFTEAKHTDYAAVTLSSPKTIYDSLSDLKQNSFHLIP
jgi:hypothetical protein